jgi:hypothetical protein
MDTQHLSHLLEEFTGTERYYPHWSGAFVYTEGVQFFADTVSAFWLLDLIASLQARTRADSMLREFQVWELKLAGKGAVAICSRDANDEVFREEIEWTDFPLDRITLYLEGGVLMLPSER